MLAVNDLNASDLPGLLQSEREEEREDEDHHHSHEDLEREADLHVIHECILACRHDERVRRSRERRGEAHARSNRYRKHERNRAYAYLHRALERYRGHEDRSYRVADEYCHHRCHGVYAGKQETRAAAAEACDYRS